MRLQNQTAFLLFDLTIISYSNMKYMFFSILVKIVCFLFGWYYLIVLL